MVLINLFAGQEQRDLWTQQGRERWDEQRVALRRKHHHRQNGEPVGRPNQNSETQGAQSCAL